MEVLNKLLAAVATPGCGLLTVACMVAGVAPAATAQLVENLRNLSLEELAEVQVTSVSKTPQSLSKAAAAIYVIRREDILRSGANTLPEMLRLAPNLHVARTGADRWIIAARGFSGMGSAQNFPNKLLVLIDGRSVYSPLFSGVYWDMLDVLAEDIDRIEVISGPGATLWGANAVNGVINVVTRSSRRTQGTVAVVGAGNRETLGRVRYGGQLGDGATYRVYAKTFKRDAFPLPHGGDADDNGRRSQAGFRVDMQRAASTFTFQGDAFQGEADRFDLDYLDTSGHNLLARWQYQAESGSAWQLQAWYDEVERDGDPQGVGFDRSTFDVELQHTSRPWARSEIVWGIGHRTHRYHMQGSPIFWVEPRRDELELTNAFISYAYALGETVEGTLALKLESGPYNDPEPLPTVRLAWAPRDNILFWGAVSRAIRTATPFDRDVQELANDTLFVAGNPNYQDEEIIAYELGYRGQPSASTTLSVSFFYNEYEDLRSIEITPVTLLPLRWGNEIGGDTYGAEAWGTLMISDRWRLSAGLATLRTDFEFTPRSSGLLGVAQTGNDPEWRASLHSQLDLGRGVALDVWLRHVDELPEPKLPSYTELDVRLAWQLSPQWELAMVGRNLLDNQHPEFTDEPRAEVPRTVLFTTRWAF